jgi:LmbE family N-acetylglucosaminyl deacetylase
VFTPGAEPPADALARTTDLCVAAHQDDIEIMAFRGILDCFGRSDRHFTGVTVTDGAGSPRDGIYARFSDDDMKAVRREEQKKAARIGEFSAHVFLDFPSAAVKDPSDGAVIDDVAAVIDASRPATVYTHNLADKHETHVAVVLRVIAAIRRMPKHERPTRVLGCEVWRDLDWMDDRDKVVLDVSGRDNLAAALLGVFDSQIAGGKRYDLAVLGRRRANATFAASHGVDQAEALTYAMDLTPLALDDALDPAALVLDHLDRFRRSVEEGLARSSRVRP